MQQTKNIQPKLSFIPPSFISTRLLNASPRTINSFTAFLYQKYKNDNYLIFEDIEGLKELISLLNKGIENVSDNLKKYGLEGVIEQSELILVELIKKKNNNKNHINDSIKK